MRLIDADALKEHIVVITYEGMWHESEVDEFVCRVKDEQTEREGE